MSESTPITGETYGEEAAKARTRAFLAAEAKKPAAEILASVEAALTRFEDGLRGVSEAQAAFAQEGGDGEDAYSISQVARHIAASARQMGLRIVAMSKGEEPPPGTGRGGLGDIPEGTVAELVAALEPAREALRQASAVAGDVEETVTHPAWGDLSCAAFLRMIGLHVEDHVRQVAKIKSEPGFPSA